MPQIPLQLPAELTETVKRILQQHRNEITEFELIRILQKDLLELFPENCFSDSLVMFRCHFLLMHCLYKIQNEYLEQGKVYLDIGQLSISQKSIQETDRLQLTSHNSLADYYLDFSNLHNTDREAVDDMLNAFWNRYLAQDDIAQALETLQLDNEAGKAEIKNRYRQLSQQHHPDKGGDPQTFHSISEAYETLKKAFN